jgi:hypothetical protein
MSAPLISMGGTEALKVMNESAAKHGAELLPGVVLPRLFNDFEAAMIREAEKICLALK